MQEVKLHFSGWILIVLILMILNWMGMEYTISSAIDRNTAAIKDLSSTLSAISRLEEQQK